MKSVSGGRLALFTFLLLNLAQIGFKLALAVVDSNSPDISGFKLRHVDLEAEARLRAEKPVTSLWAGAIHLRESLFVDANYVKCPAYAHLFNLIKTQNAKVKAVGGLDKVNRARLIRQPLIQSLAIVATYDRIFYHRIFQRSLANSAKHFMEAALGLEASASGKAHEAWLDILACLKEYMVETDGIVLKFLNDPERAKGVEAMSRFMSIPVDYENAPLGLVSHLIKRFDNQNVVVDPNMYEYSKTQVEAFDDEDTAQQRIEFGVEQAAKVVDSKHPVVIISGSEQEQLAEKPAEPASERELKDLRLVNDIEIAVPDSVANNMNIDATAHDNEPSEAETGANGHGDGQNDGLDASKLRTEEPYELDELAIMKFIKMRLESKQKTPRLSMRLVFDFRGHFENLLKAKLDLNSEVGLQAEAFRRDQGNQALYSRIVSVIDEYLKIIQVLAEIKTLNDKLESLEQFGRPLEQLNDLLDKFDSSFDLNDIRRLQAIWKLKYKEYSTIQKFIDSDGSW